MEDTKACSKTKRIDSQQHFDSRVLGLIEALDHKGMVGGHVALGWQRPCCNYD
jgi:hypothetical protein